MATLPLISIITVTYNAEKHLNICVHSIAGQSYPNIEHIIIDGASTDATAEILKRYSNSGNIAYWKSEPDTGIFNAMNKALKHAKGDWIYFLGADDFLYPEFSDIVRCLKNPNTIYYGQCQWGDTVLGGEFTPSRLTRDCICHHSVLYPASVFQKYQYNEKYKVGADHLLNIQCWSDQAFKKQYHPIIIANFSKGGFSETASDDLFEKDFSNLIWKYCSFRTFIGYMRRQIKNKS